MDPLIEEEEAQSWMMTNPISLVLQFLASYGWYLVGGAALLLYLAQKLRPHVQAWKEAREDAEYHKDPDKVLSRLEAIQRAREKQQRELEQASLRALEQQREREERRRAEAAERLRKYGAGGQRLGGAEYLPLSGSASTSTYKPPKRSKCPGGGCGR